MRQSTQLEPAQPWRRAFLTFAVVLFSAFLPSALVARLGVYQDAPPDAYARVERTSRYVEMRDGVRLAIDLYLPAGLEADAELPTLVQQTRYWRRTELARPLRGRARKSFVESFLARRGYAVVHADVRGTGASFGSRSGPWDENEVRDGYDLVQWIVEQPWSNGKVGAWGDSYSGTSAALLAAVGHPAVKVVIPSFNEFDVYTDITYPGGVFNEVFVRQWAGAIEVLDANKTSRAFFGLAGSLVAKGVAPVDGPSGRKLLRQAVAEHAANPDVYALASTARFRDRRQAGRPAIDDFSLHQQAAALSQSGTFMDFWGSWMDAGTAHAALTEAMTIGGARRAVIGAWSHGAGSHSSPFLPADVQNAGGGLTRMSEWLRAFDHHLKGIDNGFDASPRILYYTMGEERWKETDTWPPAGLAPERWFLAPDHSLTPTTPTTAGSDRYAIDFSATSGVQNRWHSQLGGADVVYADRAQQDARLLTYTSPPLTQSVEITGYPIVHLLLTSTTAENALHLYLEAVAPDGGVTYLTEGLLNTAHGQTDGAAPYWSAIPWRSFAEADAAPIMSGKQATLRFGLLPTSAVVRRGHRLRLALAGADAETFVRLPASGASTLEIARGGAAPSFIELPSRVRSDWDERPEPLALEHYEGHYALADGGQIKAAAGSGFLHLVGLDAAGTEALRPGSQRFASYKREARELVGALRDGGRAGLAKWIADPTEADALRAALKPLRKDKAPEIVATEDVGGTPITVLALDGGGHFLLIWTHATRQLVWAGPGTAAGHTRLLPMARGAFSVFDLRLYSTVTFEVDAGGDVTALSIDGHRAVRRRPPH